MDFSKLQMFRMMDIKMNYHSERQDLLARNIANTDTPGYKARDLEKLDFDSMLEPARNRKKLNMVRTAPSHQEGVFFKAPDYRDIKTRTFERKPMENEVDVEQQMQHMADNALEFQTTTLLYRKTTGLFRTAIKGNGA